MLILSHSAKSLKAVCYMALCVHTCPSCVCLSKYSSTALAAEQDLKCLLFAFGKKKTQQNNIPLAATCQTSDRKEDLVCVAAHGTAGH